MTNRTTTPDAAPPGGSAVQLNDGGEASSSSPPARPSRPRSPKRRMLKIGDTLWCWQHRSWGEPPSVYSTQVTAFRREWADLANGHTIRRRDLKHEYRADRYYWTREDAVAAGRRSALLAELAQDVSSSRLPADVQPKEILLARQVLRLPPSRVPS